MKKMVEHQEQEEAHKGGYFKNEKNLVPIELILLQLFSIIRIQHNSA